MYISVNGQILARGYGGYACEVTLWYSKVQSPYQIHNGGNSCPELKDCCLLVNDDADDHDNDSK